MPTQLLTWEQLKSDFAINQTVEGIWFNTSPYLVWGETGSPSDPCAAFSARVFRGDTVLPELVYHDNTHFSLDGVTCNGVVVDGNLTVEGDLDLIMADCGMPGYVYVRGNLSARNLFIRECCELIVEGNLTVRNTLIASRRSGGQLRVAGDLNCKHAYIGGFRPQVGGQIVNPMYWWGRAGEDWGANAPKIIAMADWHVRAFDAFDETEDDTDPRVQAHIIFRPCMFEDVPYHQSDDDKMVYWIRQGVDIFVSHDADKR